MITLLRYVAKNNRTRFYNLWIQPDLFDGVWLVREWGRLGMVGRRMVCACPNVETAQALLDKFMEIKKKKGYRIREGEPFFQEKESGAGILPHGKAS